MIAGGLQVAGSEIGAALAFLNEPLESIQGVVITSQAVIVTTFERDDNGRIIVKDGNPVMHAAHYPIFWDY